MKNNINKFLQITLISFVPTLLLWLPFIFRTKTFWGIPLRTDGMGTIVANFDGPLYIITAKSMYIPEIIKSFPFSLPVEYYAAHFPLFPILIKILAAPLGFPYSMLTVTVLSAILATYFFTKFISDYVSEREVLWMSFVFAVFPARYLIVRSVGSPEPLFLAGIIASVYYFKKEKYLLAGIWGAIAQVTKSPGILLFIAYLLYIFQTDFRNTALKKFTEKAMSTKSRRRFGVLLIPLSLIGVFVLYKLRLNDFFAYFHSGDNIHLFFPPFQIFNYSAPWVGTFWLEEIIFVYLFGILGLMRLINKKDTATAMFVGVFFITTLFVSHRDLIRYSLPIAPFILAAFSDVIAKKEFKIAMAVLIIPIYLFSLAYISQNVMPIPDWASLL